MIFVGSTENEMIFLEITKENLPDLKTENDEIISCYWAGATLTDPILNRPFSVIL